MEETGYVELNDRPPDRTTMLNMERCAAFLARMIEKYGREVLAEIEAEEAMRKENEEGLECSRLFF